MMAVWLGVLGGFLVGLLGHWAANGCKRSVNWKRFGRTRATLIGWLAGKERENSLAKLICDALDPDEDDVTVSFLLHSCIIDEMAILEKGQILSRATFPSIRMEPGDNLTITKRFVVR